MKIDWDEAKNVWNQSKHGLSFEEAANLFTAGADYLEFFDEAHSVNEDASLRLAQFAVGW